eukprot:16610-Chlamydomonas_euryale.AAC.1
MLPPCRSATPSRLSAALQRIDYHPAGTLLYASGALRSRVNARDQSTQLRGVDPGGCEPYSGSRRPARARAGSPPNSAFPPTRTTRAAHNRSQGTAARLTSPPVPGTLAAVAAHTERLPSAFCVHVSSSTEGSGAMIAPQASLGAWQPHAAQCPLPLRPLPQAPGAG